MNMSNNDNVTNELVEEYNALFLIGVWTGLRSVLYAKNKVEEVEGEQLTMDRLVEDIEESVIETEKKICATKVGREQLEFHKRAEMERGI